MSDAPPPVHAGATAGGDGPLTSEQIDAILSDFRAWLEAGGEAAPEPVGLLTLAREFTALRHEVNLQTKATRAAVEKLTEPHPPSDLREAQRPLVQALVDIADALRHGKEQVEAVVAVWLDRPRAGLFSRWFVDPLADARRLRLRSVADGYELSLRRVERALTTAGLEPIPAIGERFDPTMMEAIALADGEGQPSGTVLSESRRGYRWGGEVFRFARVTVAR